MDTFCRDNLPPSASWPELTFELPGVRYPERLNCAHELLDAVIARRGGGRRCLLTPHGDVWSYADLLRTVNQIARVLTGELGVVPGNRVLLRGPNNPWLAACWLAVIRAGAVAVTTMPLLRAGELTTVAEIAQVSLALCDWRFERGPAAPPTWAARPSCSTAGRARRPDPARRGRPGRVRGRGYRGGRRRAAGLHARAPPARPKATMHFHRDVLAIADTFSRHVLRPEPGDLFTGTPPLAFTFGLGGLLVFPLRAGAATLLIEKASPEELADEIARHQVTVCSTAPTAYRAMIAAGKAGQLGSLRRPVSAGEHLPEVDVARVPRGDRGQPHRRHRLDRDAARVRIRRRRRHPARRHRAGRARLPGRDPGRSRGAGAAGRARTAGGQGAYRLPLPQRPAPGQLRAATGGTSPATRSSRTRTATSTTRRAATT